MLFALRRSNCRVTSFLEYVGSERPGRFYLHVQGCTFVLAKSVGQELLYVRTTLGGLPILIGVFGVFGKVLGQAFCIPCVIGLHIVGDLVGNRSGLW